MKKYFNEEVGITKRDDDGFENSTGCQICDNVYIDADCKVIDHCPANRKYRGSPHGDCYIKVK